MGTFYAVGDDAPDEYAEYSDRFSHVVEKPKADKKPAKKKATAKKAK
jgi:hypothetical protein